MGVWVWVFVFVYFRCVSMWAFQICEKFVSKGYAMSQLAWYGIVCNAAVYKMQGSRVK